MQPTKDKKQGREERGDAPLNCMGRPGLPPKMAMVVLWRSFMSVLNMAQVDAQHRYVLRQHRVQLGVFGRSRGGWGEVN